AARLLREAGHRVTVGLFGERSGITGDAALAADAFPGIVVAAGPEFVPGKALVIDALYGAGLRLPLPDAGRALIGALNRSGVKVLAVDLPSGVEGAGGRIAGEAVRATATVTFARPKPGHLLLPGRAFCGSVTVADI